ncbi:hypothetical protein [Streptomyces uncialis]|uniref:hypothetical protein n=1 Tax=Streptomyces uncialis TaxID=1048205 RepID=UPI00386F9E35|nr:hypothetical protein OG924_27580 [Streptomyces uncialis]
MYELSRVLLRGVGPKAARYESVLLDFSDVGAPVASSRQGDIFDVGEPPRRPSPASMLFLENGGGKSVLLKLIFSVVLPGRREVVGTRNTRVLEGFVARGEVAHVVLEWTHAGSGKRLMTGKVSQWRDRRTSDESDLVERWYHFRPGRTVDLESLPIEEGGEYLALTEYGERLRLAAEREPALGYRIFQLHGEWTDRLMALGLDPELFRYQRAMNSDEGEAADAFSLSSDQAFVNFLLSAVLPLQPALDLAEVLSTYADKLADRGHMVLERTFIEEALNVLVPLEEARDKHSAADAGQAEARTVLDRFVHQVRARAEREKRALADRDQDVARLKDEVRMAETGHERASAVVAELARRVAQLRLEDAQGRHQGAELEWKAAVAVENGWHAVPAVLRDLEAVATARRLRDRVSETEEVARPALAARNDVARVLSQSLYAMVRNLTDEAHELTERAVGHDREATSAQKEHDSAVAAAAEGEATATAMDSRVAEVRDAIATAVREGLVPDGMAVADAAVQAGSEAVANRERITEGEKLVQDLAREHGLAVERWETARSALAEAGHVHDIARRDHEAADTTMRGLAEELNFAGVYSGQVGDLDFEAAGLADRLARILEDAETARIDVRMARAADERALTSLETTDLLPSSIEAVRICELLHEHRVSACTGWEYLAGISDVERRKELVEAFPQLVTGVLVNDSDHVELAVELLAAEDVTATGFVALGTTAALRGDGGRPPGVSFVVPPHPALYDELAGESERLQLAVRRDQDQRRLTELDSTLRTHARFAAGLAQWRDTCPPGHLAGLYDAMVAAEELVRSARGTASTAENLRNDVTERLSAARAHLPGLREAQVTIERRIEALRGLVRSAARVADWQSEALRARTGAGEYRQAAAGARGRAETARLVAAETRRTVDALLATVNRTEEELSGLPVRDTGEGTEHTGTGQPLEVLRRLYRTAAEEYSRVAVGANLLNDLEQAEREERAASKAVTSFADADRATARELLKGSDGVDSAALDAGRSRAKRRVTVTSGHRDEQYEALVRCRSVRAALGEPPPDEEPVELAPFGPPLDASHGERLVAAAEQARDEAASLAAEFRRHVEDLVQEQGEARQSVRGFKLLVDLFGEPTEPASGPTGVVPAYEGDVAGARERHGRLHGEHAAAQESAAKAEAAERTLADRLAALASDTRFDELQSASRRVMVGTGRVELPGHARTWADDLRPRLRTLQIDLDSIGRHRKQIVLQFVQQVRDALRTLKRAQRMSLLPEGLGSWSGQQFLQIGFTEVTDEVLGEFLGRVVDEAAAEGTERRGRRDARQLVLKGVEAAVEPKGFRVTILKPDVGLAVERVRVAQTKDIFSGGQILTAAIVLYCTMAALRANDRGQVRRHQHSGVLFLDNPIGRASALYLLRLQQAVAKALGVQLVYTTGLFDKTALDVFPLVIRMRNDADLRARRRYLSVANRVVARHIASLRDDPGGDIDAVRYHERPSDGVVVG